MRIKRKEYFMNLAFTAAEMSFVEGNHEKGGCCLVSKDNRLIGIGYNESTPYPFHYFTFAIENALVDCERPREIEKIYCTSFPNNRILHFIRKTSCIEIIYTKSFLKRRMCPYE